MTFLIVERLSATQYQVTNSSKFANPSKNNHLEATSGRQRSKTVFFPTMDESHLPWVSLLVRNARKCFTNAWFVTLQLFRSIKFRISTNESSCGAESMFMPFNLRVCKHQQLPESSSTSTVQPDDFDVSFSASLCALVRVSRSSSRTGWFCGRFPHRQRAAE